MPSLRLCIILTSLAFTSVLHAQTASLNLGNGSGDPGDLVTVNMTLGGGANPAGVQWTMTYPASVNYENSAVGPVASTKAISCNGTGGSTTCVVFGINTDTMSNGVVATIGFRISGGTSSTSASVQVSNESATTAGGDPINANGNGGTITINQAPPPNQAPNASNGSVTTNEDTATGVTLNATDPDGDSLSYSIVSGPSKGSLSGSGSNRTYTPNANANGADSFVFRANDGNGGTDDATVSITITPVNDAPSANNQSTSTQQNTPKGITLTGSDVDGDSLSFSIVSGPSNGSLSGSGANRTYTPNNGYSGPDSFVFRASDGNGGIDDATVSITVTASPNNPPTATDASTSTNEDTAKGITLSGTDPDGDSLSFSIVSGPSKGSLSGSGANRTYTPNPNANGPDSFVFQANDNKGGTDNGTISITINPVNDAPSANSQSTSTQQNTPKGITLSGSDIDGDSLSFSIVSGPSNGSLSGSGANRTYTPNNGFTGPDSFVFRASDGNGGIDDATVSINVSSSPNNPPTATDASTSTNEDTAKGITLSGTDPDGDSLSFSIVSGPSKGSLSGSGANRTYTPNPNANGPDSFVFQANDNKGGTDNGTISITINPVNDAPTANNQSTSTQQNTPKAITLTGSDIDGDSLSFSIVSGPSNGNLSGSGANRTYTPGNGYSGPDSFTFRASDGNGGTANATVSINVTASGNNPPTATDASTSTNEDTPKGITLSGTDPDGDSLSYSIVSGPSKGSLAGSGPNRTYVPNPNVNGADSLVFQVNDGNGGTDNGTLNITITPVNDAPTAQSQSVSTAHNTPKAITLTGSDIDGDSLSFSIVSGPSNGNLSGSGANRTYTPGNGHSGPDSFTFRASDNNGGTATATVNINVAAAGDSPNAPPTTQNQSLTTQQNTPVSFTLTGSDADGDTLSFSITTPPSNGGLGGSPPNLIYTPNNDYLGPDSFTYQVSDNNGGTANGTVNIDVLESDSLGLTLLSCNQNTLSGGGSVSCNVFINGPAPSRGFSVGLSGGTSQLDVPATVDIAPNATSGSFNVSSDLIQTAGTAQLTATLLGVSVGTTLNLVPLQATGLSCVPVQIMAGDTLTCEISLNSAGFSLNVSSSISSTSDDVQVPANITLSPGAAAASFQGSSSDSSEQQSVTITATVLGAQVSTIVSIVGDGPVIAVETDQVASVGKSLSIGVTAEDPEGLPVTLSARNLPVGAQFIRGTGEFSWTPTEEQVGTHEVIFRASNTANKISQKIVIIEVIFGSIQITSLTNAASLSSAFSCSPGALATLWGIGFSESDGEAASTFPLPTTLGGVRVLFNDEAARLLYVGRRQINLQCPSLPPGTRLRIRVERVDGSVEPVSLTSPDLAMKEATPGMFTLDGSGGGQGLIINANTGKLCMLPNENLDGQAARAGDDLTIYANGLGLVDHSVALGEPAGGSPLSRVVGIVRARVGGVYVPVTFAGLAPNAAGVFQVNVFLTGDVPSGARVTVVLEIQLEDGTVLESNPVTIAIQVGTVLNR